MEYKPLQPYISWDISRSEKIVFQTEHNSITKCAFECSYIETCRFFTIYQDICFGISAVISASSQNQSVQMYAKQSEGKHTLRTTLHLFVFCIICILNIFADNRRIYTSGTIDKNNTFLLLFSYFILLQRNDVTI